MQYSIIGEADGPTAVFLAGKVGEIGINVFGLLIVALMLIPNIIYAIKYSGQENKCTNKVMNILEQVGRYGSMILMVLNVEIVTFEFSSIEFFMLYFMGNVLLILLYWIVWILFFVKRKAWKAMMLALLPAIIFVMSGITLGNVLLLISGLLFGVAHMYVTRKNYS